MFGRKVKNFFAKLSPKKRIAAVVDAVFDRVNDKYKATGKLKVVDGGFEFEFQFVDVKPDDKIELPDDDADDVR